MSLIVAWFGQVLHLALMVAAAPVACGAADWLDGRFRGRAGPPVSQPWRDLVRLWRKQRGVVERVSAVSRAAPLVGLGSVLCAGALVPSFCLGMASAPLADVLVIVSLLGVERVAWALAALDAGSAAPGFAAQRDSAMSVVAEPAVMLAAFAMAAISGTTNLDAIIAQQKEGLLVPSVSCAVALVALLIVVFIEAGTGRAPVEPVFGGPDLAIARLGSWMRRIVWIDLIGGLFLPIGLAAPDGGLADWLIGALAWAAKLGLLVAGVAAARAVFGSASARTVPGLVGIAAILALLAVVMVLTSAVPA